MRNPLTKEAFADWCEQQGDREYDYWDHRNCACSQYADSLGLPFPKNPIFQSQELQYVAWKEPHTFSALATRLRTGEA